MLPRLCLGIALFATAPVWAQLEAIPFETPTSDNSRMLTPPPVSGIAYPTVVGSQTRSNYLAAGFVLNTAYDDNVLAGSSSTPVSDIAYSIAPTIILDQSTVRQQLGLTVSPGFTFYQRTSVLNAANQNAALNYQYRLSPHTTIRLSDSFQKSSNAFDQLSEETLSGSVQPSQAQVFAPYANQLSNVANVGLSYQFSRNGMIGAGGIFTQSNYSNPTQASGLNNSNSWAGSAFYSHRLSPNQYFGVTYQYSKSQATLLSNQANPVDIQTDVDTQSILAFYTIYLDPSLSLSFSIGPQYFDATQTSSPRVTSWTPSTTESISWQRSHTNLVARYSRTISGSTGLSGAFDSSAANATASFQMARTWMAMMSAGYVINKNATPSFTSSDPGGHSLSGTVSVQHPMGQRLTAEFGYTRLHQSYGGVATISANPDSDRVYISVSYKITRPLGR